MAVKINKKSAVTSIVYSTFQTSLGLLLHPYQTMQDSVNDKWFVWLAGLPTVLLAILTFIWRFSVVPLGQLFISCVESGFWGCSALIFISNWITFFCVFWQILLIYLLFRFKSVYSQD